MIVTTKNLKDVVAKLLEPDNFRLGLDTETTGLQAYQGDRMFSLIITDENESYYFNFQDYPDINPSLVLSRDVLSRELAPVFAREDVVWYIHNAKFDMHMLANEGGELEGRIHCTMAMARLLISNRFKYSLDVLLAPYKRKKSDLVARYIAEHKLFDMITVPDKKKRVQRPYYERVPFEIISKYGVQDGDDVRFLGLQQAKDFSQIQKQRVAVDQADAWVRLYKNEAELTKTCFRMERRGIKIDRAYTEEALEFWKQKRTAAADEFTKLSGIVFKDSRVTLAKAFDAVGESYPKTEKGNASFTDAVLEGATTPLARLVQQFREANKYAGTYFSSFIYYADHSDVVHCNLNQAGAKTGRMSSSDPNLQNIPKEEDPNIHYIARRSFIPRNEDVCLVMIDYDQMEYRLMLDLAEEMKVIEQVLGGLDVHEATAKMMGVKRSSAKTLNFLLLYGGGIAKLAGALGITEDQAARLRRQYFAALPSVIRWTKEQMALAKVQRCAWNWYGRRFKTDPGYEYRVPNGMIQGGCADIVKIAMNECEDFLAGKKSKLILQVHDELLFEMHKSELDTVPELVRIMEKAYPYKHLPLTAGVSYSWKSWGDKIDGLPSNAASSGAR